MYDANIVAGLSFAETPARAEIQKILEGSVNRQSPYPYLS
jgi:hypothetical protein